MMDNKMNNIINLLNVYYGNQICGPGCDYFQYKMHSSYDHRNKIHLEIGLDGCNKLTIGIDANGEFDKIFLKHFPISDSSIFKKYSNGQKSTSENRYYYQTIPNYDDTNISLVTTALKKFVEMERLTKDLFDEISEKLI